MIIPSFPTRHWSVYGLVAAFALTMSLIACGGGSASDPSATAAPANTPTNTIVPTNIIIPTITIQAPAPTPVATLAAQSLATEPPPTVQEPTPTPPPTEDGTMAAAGGFTMGGAALGGNAETTLLAQITLLEVPEGRLSWVAHESTLAAGQSIEHVHEFAFVYAMGGPHQFQAGQDDRNLSSGEGAVVAAGEPHRHIAPAGPSVFWLDEVCRVLKPGGALLLADSVAPEEDGVARWMNDIELRRDFSHIQNRKATNIESLLEDRDLRVSEREFTRIGLRFNDWAARTATSEAETRALRKDFLAASTPVKEAFQIRPVEGDDAGDISFSWPCLILRAVKS